MQHFFFVYVFVDIDLYINLKTCSTLVHLVEEGLTIKKKINENN